MLLGSSFGAKSYFWRLVTNIIFILLILFKELYVGLVCQEKCDLFAKLKPFIFLSKNKWNMLGTLSTTKLCLGQNPLLGISQKFCHFFRDFMSSGLVNGIQMPKNRWYCNYKCYEGQNGHWICPKQMSCQILSPDPDMHCIADGSASFLEELFWRWNVFKHFHGNYIG